VPASKQANESRQHSHIPLGSQQVRVHGKFVRQLFTEGTAMFQADDFRLNALPFESSDHVDKQRLGATDRHAGDHKQTPQGTVR
jgi:hypothetical protein